MREHPRRRWLAEERGGVRSGRGAERARAKRRGSGRGRRGRGRGLVEGRGAEGGAVIDDARGAERGAGEGDDVRRLVGGEKVAQPGHARVWSQPLHLRERARCFGVRAPPLCSSDRGGAAGRTAAECTARSSCRRYRGSRGTGAAARTSTARPRPTSVVCRPLAQCVQHQRAGQPPSSLRSDGSPRTLISSRRSAGRASSRSQPSSGSGSAGSAESERPATRTTATARIASARRGARPLATR